MMDIYYLMEILILILTIITLIHVIVLELSATLEELCAVSAVEARFIATNFTN